MLGAALLAWMLQAATLAPAAELGELEALGKQIFVSGEGSSSEEPVTVYIGEEALALPASVAPCASCHGPDGRGRPEGGVIPSDVTWANLTKSYGHKHSYGRSHGAYDERSLAKAIVDGVDPAGNPLGEVMPVYSMSDSDMQALIVYMKRLQSDSDPGLGEHSIRIATLLPTPTEPDSPGQAMAAVMQAYVSQLNVNGGIFNRQLELTVIPAAESASGSLQALSRALENNDIFALAGVYAVGMEEGLSEVVEQARVPLIGPFTSAPAVGGTLDRYAFYLFAGPGQRERVLMDYASGELGIPRSAMARVGARAASQFPDLQLLEMEGNEGAAAALARSLGASGVGAVFFSGHPDELSALLTALSAADSQPYIFIAPELVTPALFAAPPAFHKRVLVAYPTLPADIDNEGRRLYAGLAQDNALSAQHVSAQVSVLAAMKLLAEGLKRAGRELSRDKLILELEALNGYKNGLTPPLSFNLNRRVGALGAYVVALDLGARTLVPVSGWRELGK
jgi:ABC-type branched-subunit amino acid transport system substrate-binding protein